MNTSISHTGQLLIDLDSIARNWRYLSVRSAAACGAVVKANAYGLGVTKVASRLLSEGCQIFFVATLCEAIELRESVPGLYQIIVFGGQAAAHPKECLEYSLTPVLVTLEQVLWWSRNVQKSGLQPIIKFDSGMHRLGLSEKDVVYLCETPELLKKLSPSYFMSHLACADMPEHPLNLKQLTSFEKHFSLLKSFLPTLKATFSNSSGCFLGLTYHYHLIRPGIALYGGNPQPESLNLMHPVVTLNLPIMQIKALSKGDFVGYGAEYVMRESGRLAVVFGGYADGLLRCLGDSGYGFYKGLRVPIAGRVSMDAIAFDITHVPEDGDERAVFIEILGERQSIDDLATAASTIGYEILTSLGSRYQRSYYSDQD